MRGARRRQPPEPSPRPRKPPLEGRRSPAAPQPLQPSAAGRTHPQQQQRRPLLGAAAAALAGLPAGSGGAAVLARLRSLAEGGAVVPLPCLRAADLGAPAALLNDVRAAYLPPDKMHLLGHLVRNASSME